VAKRPLTDAEIAQRRAAGKLGGRPSSPVSKREVDKLARERAAVARARGMIRSVQEEVAAILIAGMRGTLPGSTAQSMLDAASKLAAKGGLHDTVAVKNIGEGPNVNVRIGVDTSQYPEPVKATDARDEDGSALAH
jgi:hypothetical protein